MDTNRNNDDRHKPVVTALLLPEGNGDYPSEVLVDATALGCATLIGAENRHCSCYDMTGTVKGDEYAIKVFTAGTIEEPADDMEPNYYATALLGYEVWGPALVFGGPESCDIPDNMRDYLTTEFTVSIMETFAMGVATTAAIHLATESGWVSEESVAELHGWLAECMEMHKRGEDTTEIRKRIDSTLEAYIALAAVATEHTPEEAGALLADEAEAFLRGLSS